MDQKRQKENFIILKCLIITAFSVKSGDFVFDKGLEEPNYDFGGMQDQSFSGPDSGGDYSEKPKINIKKIVPYIIVVIILAVVVGGVFLWLGSQQTITFNIKELDGGAIPATFSLYNSDNTYVEQPVKATTHTFTLSPGTYTYRVMATGYTTKNGSITIPNMNGSERVNSIEIKLEKDIDVSLQATLSAQKIYQGQTIDGEIEITNNAEEVIQGETLIAEQSKSVFDVIFTPSVIDLSAGGATRVSFSVTINSKQTLNETMENNSITIRVKGTNIKSIVKLDASPALAKSEIQLLGPVSGTITDSSLTAGSRKTITTLKLKNNTKRNISLENVLVKIEANTGYEDKLDWFEFGQYYQEKNKFLINSVGKGLTEQIVLNVEPEIDAIVGDEFRGTLTISSLSLQEDLVYDMIFTIKNAREASLALTTNPSFSSTCTDSGCSEILTTNKIILKNTGTDKIENILIGIDTELSDGDCLAWLSVESTNVVSLNPNESTNLKIGITPTNNPEKANTECYLDWTFDDPIHTGEKITDRSVPILVRVTVR